MVFGACMEFSGKMDRIISEILKMATSPKKLLYSTMGFCIFANLSTSDQYLSVVIPGKTLKPSYEKMNMDLRYLSRTLEDSGTITSVLIPWNSCGVFMSTSLGILTLAYLPFCFFHWIHLSITILNIGKKDNFSVIE
jgi:NhaC family Na+:H+ antiporter